MNLKKIILFILFTLSFREISSKPMSDFLPNGEPIAVFTGNLSFAGNQGILVFYPKHRWVLLQKSEKGADMIEGTYTRSNSKMILKPKELQVYCRTNSKDFVKDCRSLCNPDCTKVQHKTALIDEHNYYCESSQNPLETEVVIDCLNTYTLRKKFPFDLNRSNCLKTDLFCHENPSELCYDGCRVEVKKKRVEIRVRFRRTLQLPALE